MAVPSFVGNFTRFGRPFASKPSSQFVFTYGLPLRNSPVVRSSTYITPLRFAHSITLRGLPCHWMSASTGTCVES